MISKKTPLLIHRKEDLETLTAGEVVLFRIGKDHHSHPAIYEGNINGQDSFLSPGKEGSINSWRSPRVNLSFADSGIIDLEFPYYSCRAYYLNTPEHAAALIWLENSGYYRLKEIPARYVWE